MKLGGTSVPYTFDFVKRDDYSDLDQKVYIQRGYTQKSINRSLSGQNKKWRRWRNSKVGGPPLSERMGFNEA